jgi:hypothetical protein
VKKLAKKVKGCEHKLYMDYMDNFLLQPWFYSFTWQREIKCCWIARPNKKGVPHGPNTRKWSKQTSITVRKIVRKIGDLVMILWAEQQRYSHWD